MQISFRQVLDRLQAGFRWFSDRFQSNCCCAKAAELNTAQIGFRLARTGFR